MCKVGRGSSPRPKGDPQYFDNGTIPWIKVADATASGKYLYETKETVNQSGAKFSRLLPIGSLIICTSGTLGLTKFLGVEGCIHDGWLYTYDYNGLDPDFFYYFLQTQRSYFASVASGAAIQNISTEILRSTPICLPAISEQIRIASILTAYDDLIENNRRRMALLEDAARKLYREWFIRLHFPGYESTPIHNGLPEGWEMKTLGDLCEAIRDIATPDQVDADTPYIGLEHIPRRSISQNDWGKAEDVSSSKHKFSAGDILFGKIRPYFHKVSLAFVDGVASADAIVIRPKEAGLHSLVLMTVSSDAFVAMASQTMKEGSKMPRADWKQMQAHEVPRPPLRVLEAFNQQIVPITEQLRNLTFQTRKLRTARDRLLPKLMSGEIEV